MIVKPSRFGSNMQFNACAVLEITKHAEEISRLRIGVKTHHAVKKLALLCDCEVMR